MINFWKKKIPKFIYEIKYENLISDSTNQIKNLIKYCDLDWDQDCLNFYNNKNSIKTLSVKQARNKIYNTSVNSFENYNNDDLKLEIRLLYTVYIRNFVWGKNWKTFFNQKHQLKDVEQWCLSMSNEFLRW